MPRPKKPLALHVIQGTARKDRMEKRRGELVFAATGVGDPPEWFDDVQRAEWARISCDLAGVLAPAHRPTAAHYCVLYSRFVADAQGGRPMMATERTILHSIMMQMGMTPASQSKVVAPKKEEGGDPWARFE